MCDGTQNVEQYRYQYFFRYQIFSDTGSETFFRYRFRYHQKKWKIINLLNSKILATNISSGTKFFRYRFRYHQKKWKIPSTGTGTHYKCSKCKKKFEKNLFRYQIFPIPVPRPFSGTKFFRYRFRDFFPVPIFSDTSKKMKNSRYREFPVPVCHTLEHSQLQRKRIYNRPSFNSSRLQEGSESNLGTSWTIASKQNIKYFRQWTNNGKYL